VLHFCTSRSGDINLAVPSAIHFSQTSFAIGSGRWSRTSCEISFMCDSPVQGALRNRSDLHAAELQKKRDKWEPRLVKGER